METGPPWLTAREVKGRSGGIDRWVHIKLLTARVPKLIFDYFFSSAAVWRPVFTPPTPRTPASTWRRTVRPTFWLWRTTSSSSRSCRWGSALNNKELPLPFSSAWSKSLWTWLNCWNAGTAGRKLTQWSYHIWFDQRQKAFLEFTKSRWEPVSLHVPESIIDFSRKRRAEFRWLKGWRIITMKMINHDEGCFVSARQTLRLFRICCHSLFSGISLSTLIVDYG